MPISAEDLSSFKHKVYLTSGYRLEAYKEDQLDRRLVTLMGRAGYESLDTYFYELKKEDPKLSAFIQDITINETEFFRNPERFKSLKKHISQLPVNSRFKVWSAGCSTGPEAYSLLILFENLRLAEKTHFYATDIDAKVLNEARQGIYSQSLLKQVSPSDLNYYFSPASSANDYQINEKWRNKMSFETHDLLQDTYPNSFDLIACRNVMIYFKKEIQAKICQQFYDSLRENGILFIGGAEQILNFESMGFTQLSPFLYQKNQYA